MGFFSRKPDPKLAKLMGKRNVDGLIRALRDKEPDTRQEGVMYLGAIGSKKVEALIKASLEDESVKVRYCALLCLSGEMEGDT